MAKDPCFDLIKQARFRMSDEEARDLIKKLREEKQHLIKLSPGDWQVKFKKKIVDDSERVKWVAQQREIQVKRQIFKDPENLKRIRRDAKTKENFSAFLVGSTKKKEGFLDSVWSLGHAMGSLRLGRIFSVLPGGNSALSRPSVFGYFPFGRGLFDQQEFQAAVVQELFPFTGKQKGNNDLAFKMADAINKEQRELVNLANSEGAAIGWLDDFVTTQYHDLRKIEKAGFEKWKSDISGFLDEDRTFFSRDMQDRENFLQQVYDNIIQNKRALADAAPDEVGMGKMSLANMMSQSRQLHFRNADSWLKYNSLYGHENPIQGIIRGIERMSANVVLIQKFGANPDFTFNKYLKSFPELTPKETARIKSEYAQVSGKAHQVGNPTLHKWEQSLAAIQNMSKLGKATVSAFTDPMYSAFGAHYRGKNYFSAYYETYKTGLLQSPFWKTASSKEKREFARKLGIALDGVIGSAAMRFDSNGGGPGTMQRMVDNYFKLTGLNGWTNWWAEGAAILLADDLADATRKSFSELTPRFQVFLGNYGITEIEWKALSKFEPDVVGDAKLFTPELIYRDLEEKIAAIPNPTKEDLNAFKQQRNLGDKLQNLFVTENENQVIRPGGRERAFMSRVPLGGDDEFARPGTPSGMAAKLFWQFRSFGLSMMFKNYPRVWEMGMPAAMHLIPMVGLGYAAKSAKDLLKGKEPVDPFVDLEAFSKTVIASVLQSGFGGIVGDLVFNDYRKYGHSFWDVSLGPTASTMQDFAMLYSAFVRGDDFAARTWNALKRNAPYGNFWLTSTLMDYFINFQIQEFLNPGYLRRMERRARKKNNQEFLWSPAQFVNR